MEEDKENEYSLPLMQSKIDVQNQLITLMQTEMEIQNEKISVQETQIKELTSIVKELQEQVAKLITGKVHNPVPVTAREDSRGDHKSTEVSPKAQDEINENVSSSSADKVPVTSVAEMARQTAEATLATSGFVYDENSGLYYDYSSGYYYDSNRQLYYNGHTRTYYSYVESSKEYVFHSQLPPETQPTEHKTQAARKRKIKHRATQTVVTKTVVSEKDRKSGLKNICPPRNADDIEEGELSGSSSDNDTEDSITIIEKADSSDSDGSHGTIEVRSDTDDEETSAKEAPCIRAIVHASASTSPKLEKGFLFIVTCMGGTIGREGSHHTIIIPDSNVSKEHAKITYEFEEVCDGATTTRLEKKYFITDLGSQNGTFLNRQRLSASNVISDPFELVHGSVLQILDTQLLIHIHTGLKTCGHCEPGLILEKEAVRLNGPVLNQAQKEAGRKKALRKMRQKYAIGPAQVSTIPKLVEKYKDRAEDRRRLLGSDHPSFKIAEAEPASIHVPINAENKGFKMMKKMGWSAGESLGQTGESGMREPVKFAVKNDRAGLGSGARGFGNENLSSSPPPSHHVSGKQKKKNVFLQKTVKRYFAAGESPVPGDASKKDGVIQLD